ncbi:MAG: hypothetical protein HRF42_14535 [Candidatus Brocadia sp.]|jgi:hypothetical protein
MLIEFNPKIKIAMLYTVNINVPPQYIALFGEDSITIKDNIVSIKAFQRAGFEESHVIYVLDVKNERAVNFYKSQDFQKNDD